METIWNFAIGGTTAIVLFVGFLAIILGGIVAIDYLIMAIIRRMGMFPALWDFIMERSRKKYDNK